MACPSSHLPDTPGSQAGTNRLIQSLTVVYPCLQIATVVNNGAGRHIWEATYVDYNQYAYNLGICQVIFYVAVGLIKLSIALFVRRLTNTLRAWRIFVDVFIGTLIIYIGMAIFCKPDCTAVPPLTGTHAAMPSKTDFVGRTLTVCNRVGFPLFAAPGALGQAVFREPRQSRQMC